MAITDISAPVLVAEGVVVKTQTGTRVLVFANPFGFKVLGGPGILVDSDEEKALTDHRLKAEVTLLVEMFEAST